MSFYSDIIDLILSGSIQSKEDLHRAKIKLCSKYNLRQVPSDSEILQHIPEDLSENLEEKLIKILRRKPMRTISGVAIIAVMTSPEACPHGRCTPCPGGPQSNTPQSYTGYEPAALRASRYNFDPYLQTKARLNQLHSIGHDTDKIDLIIMGGTFTARPFYYQEWFIKRCLDALNDKVSSSLIEAQDLNESAPHRCIGLTVETRPDWFRLQHVDQSLHLGATRVELGVQTVYDDILYNIRRGHTVTDSIQATRIAKESGLKVCYHMMPGLPGSDSNKDLEAFKTIFKNPNFKPDMLKIYPTLVIKGTELYKKWKKGEYQPLTNEKAVSLISKIKTFVPEWVRIQRIQRDVPAQYIVAGVTKSNLRQLVEEEMRRRNKRCRCIRCREVGHKILKENLEIEKEEISLKTIRYTASGGEEVFISLVEEENDALIGYLRLRDITHPHRRELLRYPCMIIRELKVVGREIPIGRIGDGWQHRGFGKILIREAERICREEFNKRYLFVLSGIGVKQYYRTLGFQDNGAYLMKVL
ncbi:MAG: tRNA uridine(34) 5-carboxymethylaminomethyl modification radical SAM/GNAT enzyme Elp3 [Thermoplasmata archaeon]|nr:MAG: tRNA uridine(34) 5-carboxymethylaminomethyl modification radical SAM/GNAT enzyme Elp3 [Thermoplasmata archaeon]